MILKDKPLKTGINKFIDVLEPLEYKSLPIIREVEKLLQKKMWDKHFYFYKIRR